MCGIAGVLNLHRAPVGPGELAAMAATLRHRGPDGAGVFAPEGAPVGLVHTRLSVLDLETGDQPMLSPDGSLALVFNGEIYNFRELRARLEGLGYRFRTRSDTEVILHAYAEWGERCPEHLDGMFAFALWDGRERRLLLARDRTGKKPLFVYRDAERLVFGSEMKAILACGGVDDTLDPAAVPLYLTYGYVPSPGTFYRSIRKLPPATTLAVRPDGTAGERRYWSPVFDGTGRRVRMDDAVEEVRELMTAAVRRRMVADVPVGAFLSGGIDSTIVVGLMSRLADRPVRTFSIGFSGDARFDETDVARSTARRLGTEHTEFVVEPAAIELLDDLVTAYDEPFGDSSAIPTSTVSRLSREAVTVALTGDGGDELFGGYLRLHAGALSERIPSVLRRAGGHVARWLPANGHPRGLPARAARFLSAAADPLPDRYLRWIGFFPDATESLLHPEVRAAVYDRAAVRASFRTELEGGGGSTLDRLLRLNFNTYLLDDLLVKADRCSMMHSLELRSPFLDTALIEFAGRLPDSFRRRGRSTKYLLRRAFPDLLPPDLLARGKMGFGVPLDTWFRTRWRNALEEGLLDPASSLYEWLDRGAVQGMVARHLSGEANLGHQLWSLLTLERWLSRRAGARGSASPGRTAVPGNASA